jgi:DNA-binding transcriptional regulator YiaG
VLTLQDNWAQLINHLRKRTGLSQEKFAAKVGVTYPTINRWERGHVKPSPLALRRIETLLKELGPEAHDLLAEPLPEETPK